MKPILSALILSATLGVASLATAQEARLSGTVTELFGSQMILATPEGRILVALPEGAARPAVGAQVSVSGTRNGETFAASALSATTGAAPVPTPAPAASAAEAALPGALRGLGLRDIRIRNDDDDGERYIHARLPEGGHIRVEARGDRIEEIQSDSTGLPQALIEMLLPAAIRADARLAEVARVTEIEFEDDGEISVEGYARDGMRVELEFARDGRLLKYEMERDDRRSMAEPAAREQLAALGYQDIGVVRRGGRHVDAVARNPYGEWVEVRLDEQGRVSRERMWQD